MCCSGVSGGSSSGGGGAGTPSIVNWTTVSEDTQLVSGNGYFANGVARVPFLLPEISQEGDVIKVNDKSGNGWTITQNSGQQIVMGALYSSTVGVGGSLASQDINECLTLRCQTDNLTWMVEDSSSGNLTIL